MNDIADEKLNFEEFEKDLDGLDLEAIQKDLNDLKKEEIPFEKIRDNICKIYRGVRPILKGIPKIPFIPKKIKAAITTLCEALDLLCGLN